MADVRESTDRGDVIAAIDVGTNSVHMVVARVEPDAGIEVLTRHKETVRLGESASEMKTLSEDGIDRAVAALKRCADIAGPLGAEVRAVATSAVREAHNAHELLSRAATEAGVEVEVISGVEEARLIHLGVLAAMPVFEKTIAVCDIGGGSTEVLVGRGTDILAVRSFKLGAIRLTRRFFPDGEVLPGALDAARVFVRETMLPFALEALERAPEMLIGSSGTIETMVRMALAARGEDQKAKSLNGVAVTFAEVQRALNTVAAIPTAAGRAGVAGLDAGRLDIIVGGGVILEQVMEALGQTRLGYSDFALREGVLLDAFQRRTGSALHHLSDIRRKGVERLMLLGDEDAEHTRRVAALAFNLFEALQVTLGLDDDAAELLEAAALLSNVGVMVAHSKHHLHSYYVIRSSDRLVGFTDGELEVIAQVARYHRKSAPSTRHREFAALDEDRQRLVRSLAAILRVAVGLDRSHRGSVADVDVRIDDVEVRIRLVPSEGLDVDTEAHAAQERAALLSDVSGRSVVVSA